MKKTKFTEIQIIKAIKEALSDRQIKDVSFELGINPKHFTTKRKSIQILMDIKLNTQNLKPFILVKPFILK